VERIARWTYWRVQLPFILWAVGFVPLVDFWAPALSGSRQLNVPYLALALFVLTIAALAGARVCNRVVYTVLLRGVPVQNRFPSRAERRASSRQFGPSARNFFYFPLPVAFLGLWACATTMFIGALREDLFMWSLGALVSPLFWYAFVKEGVDTALRWITNRA
jgi:hypothetical protein